MRNNSAVVKAENIISQIHLIRGEKVILDVDLAILYGVETKQLTRAVRRNIYRFPADFMFQLTIEEMKILRSQFGTSSWGGRRYPPLAFTEQGVAMLSGILKSCVHLSNYDNGFQRIKIWRENLRRLKRNTTKTSG